jgi:hypothetical protein
VVICVVLAPNQYCVGYANPDASYPLPVEGGGAYVDGYGRLFFYFFTNVGGQLACTLTNFMSPEIKNYVSL